MTVLRSFAAVLLLCDSCMHGKGVPSPTHTHTHTIAHTLGQHRRIHEFLSLCVCVCVGVCVCVCVCVCFAVSKRLDMWGLLEPGVVLGALASWR